MKWKDLGHEKKLEINKPERLDSKKNQQALASAVINFAMCILWDSFLAAPRSH